MSFTSTLKMIQNHNIRSLLTIFLISSSVEAQHHHGSELTDKVREVVTFTDKKVELAPEVCPDPKDPAFVNFDKKHLNDPSGFHGMLFFGQGETFYISHLPMFHKPHDYQAIIQVRLQPDAAEKYRAGLAQKGGYFTFAPEGNFVLPEVVTKKSPIKGTLVQGHFERGGKELLSAELELVRVVFYKKISGENKRPAKEKYVIFGNSDGHFMAHEIFEKPNVDEIIPIPKSHTVPKGLANEVNEQGVSYVDELTVKDGKVILKKGNDLVQFPYKEFYRETGDLQ